MWHVKTCWWLMIIDDWRLLHSSLVISGTFLDLRHPVSQDKQIDFNCWKSWFVISYIFEKKLLKNNLIIFDYISHISWSSGRLAPSEIRPNFDQGLKQAYEIFLESLQNFINSAIPPGVSSVLRNFFDEFFRAFLLNFFVVCILQFLSDFFKSLKIWRGKLFRDPRRKNLSIWYF